MLTLSAAQRRFLKALAHKLEPSVMIGHSGVTEAIINEAARALAKHELIKVRVLAGDRRAREAALDALCEKLNAAPVQQVGKVLVIYRPAEKPVIVLPQDR